MRYDPQDLEKVLAALREACYTHPEQRIGQCLNNALVAADLPQDTFYIEDDKLLDALANYTRI